MNRSKRSITLDLDRPEARDLFLRLVAVSDAVIENYSPGVMERLGLGAERLRQANPEIVYVSMPGFGDTGPYRRWLAFGPLIEAASGLNAEMAIPARRPIARGLRGPIR